MRCSVLRRLRLTLRAKLDIPCPVMIVHFQERETLTLVALAPQPHLINQLGLETAVLYHLVSHYFLSLVLINLGYRKTSGLTFVEDPPANPTSCLASQEKSAIATLATVAPTG